MISSIGHFLKMNVDSKWNGHSPNQFIKIQFFRRLKTQLSFLVKVRGLGNVF